MISVVIFITISLLIRYLLSKAMVRNFIEAKPAPEKANKPGRIDWDDMTGNSQWTAAQWEANSPFNRFKKKIKLILRRYKAKRAKHLKLIRGSKHEL